MSMATPFEPEPAHDEAAASPVVPDDDLLVDADTADGAAVDEAAPDQRALPDDEVLADPETTDADDPDAVEDALDSEGPQGYRTPQAGGGMTASELRSDLAE